ncbi:sigma-70 family RNA polymerase sigma factor [Arachnia propionica]
MSFEEIYTQHYASLLATVERRVNSQEDAEEIVAEVFRVAWGYHCSGGALEVPWLFETARNLIGNEYRARRRRAALQARIALDCLVQRQGCDVVSGVREAVDCLCESYREVLVLAYWQGMKATEIASLLNVSAEAVRARLARARKSLRMILEERQL